MPQISLCPRRNSTIFSGSNNGQDGINEDHLYDLIMSRQADRLDDQRSELGGRPKSCSALPMDIPDLDDVSELVIAMQAGRFETQRAHLKPPTSSDTQLHVSQHDNDCPPRCVSASANINGTS